MPARGGHRRGDIIVVKSHVDRLSSRPRVVVAVAVAVVAAPPSSSQAESFAVPAQERRTLGRDDERRAVIVIVGVDEPFAAHGKQGRSPR